MVLERFINRLITLVEYGAAAFLALVTALTFVSVIMRYVLSAPVPDSYDFTRLTICVAIFWGLACACWRGEHIQVDLLWSALPRRAQLFMDLVAQTVLLGCMAVLAWAIFVRVGQIIRSGMSTGDLLVPMWPFFAVASLGLGLAVLVLPIYILRLIKSRPSP